MRFKVYRIKKHNREVYEVLENISSEKIYEELVKSPKLEENDNEFAVMYLKKYEQFVLGTLVQSFHKVLTKFDENNTDKKEVEIEDSEINDKTLFYINCKERFIYIQSKRYPEGLNAQMTKERLERTVGRCVNEDLTFFPTEIRNSLEQVNEIFKTSYVKRVAFRNLEGLELPQGVELHNPRKELDDALVESYNTYSKDNIDYMELKAKNGEKLSKNPFAKIGMKLAEVYQEVDVFKDMDIIESGEKINIKMDGNDSQIINITTKQKENPRECYKKILKSNIKEYDEE